MANYSFEKGKYGGPCGAIFPFFRQIEGNLPVDGDFKDFVPAGFLKCRGQILSADQFPHLAELIGVGSSCIYRKANTTLQERNDDGTGGTFQLPDLGSKYITTSTNPGLYANDTATDTVAQREVPRAGIAVTLTSNGDSVEFVYSGDFRSPGVSNVALSGGWRPVSPPSRTTSTNLAISNFVAHGHRGTYSIGGQINTNSQGMLNASWTGFKYIFVPFPIPICTRRVARVCEPDENFGVTWAALNITDSGSDSSHNHQLGTPSISVNPRVVIPPVLLSGSSLITTVSVRTREIFKMDDIAPKFILCEYLIKF